MPRRWLGMYVHMHWGYHHPYAARTWTLEDWRAYLGGISALGYNLLQIWPMVDTMPLPLTPSDEAHLDKLRQVIELAHREHNLTVWLVLSANAVGNAQAASYPFEERPYFTTERRLNPGDRRERAELMVARRAFLEPLAEADGLSIIDSDPGGYEGSPPAEFVQLLLDHRRLADRLRPGMRLNYWMWWGWRPKVVEVPNAAELRDQVLGETLEALARANPEPWGLLACNRDHLRVVAEHGLQARTLYYPYGAIEDEPSVPRTNNDPARLAAAFEGLDPTSYPLGAMGNAQNHVLQLPHTYLFSQIARGRGESVSLRKFAHELIPALGGEVAEGWAALVDGDGARAAAARERLLAAAAGARAGRLGGLMFHDPARFLGDLAAQLAQWEATLALREALAQGCDPVPAAQRLLAALEEGLARTGFRDFYVGAFAATMHPLLAALAGQLSGGAALQRALDEYAHLRQNHVPERHGYLARLVAALAECAGLRESPRDL